MAIVMVSTALPLAKAPEDMAALARHWYGLCGARKNPSRHDIDPMELRAYLGYLCILEVANDPVDFTYRLFGSGLVKFLRRDLTGQSVLALPPLELGQSIFRQVEDTIEAGAPMHFRTEVIHDSPYRKSGTSRLLLPLSDDGETINQLLTYTQFDDAPPDFWSHIAGESFFDIGRNIP